MAQSDTIRYEPKLADIAIFRICKQGVVGSIPIVSTRSDLGISASSVDRMTKTSCTRLTGGWPATNVVAMGIKGNNERHRVLVPQALGSDEFLRVTWHASRELIVFSHWDGDHCDAATPVRITDIEELATLISKAAGHVTNASAWPPPAANTLVVPAIGLTVPPARRSA